VFERFRARLFEHSHIGSALTFQGVQKRRKSVYDYECEIKKCQIPVLILVGDEDFPCIEPALFMKRNFPKSGLVTFPQSGHAINIEEPALFNGIVEDFLVAVDQEDWAFRSNFS
jgi:pimeloyl-ACP methyl ester carboxylesterase